MYGQAPIEEELGRGLFQRHDAVMNFMKTGGRFGRRDTPVIVAWIFAAHQMGGALAAFGAGAVRSVEGSYLLAFVASGMACLLASMLVLRVSRPTPALAVAE